MRVSPVQLCYNIPQNKPRTMKNQPKSRLQQNQEKCLYLWQKEVERLKLPYGESTGKEGTHVRKLYDDWRESVAALREFEQR